MSRRPTLSARPWLNNSSYDLLTRPSVLHFDAFAYSGPLGVLYFKAEYRDQGRKLIAASTYQLAVSGLEAIEFDPFALPKVMWSRENHRLLSIAHRQLVELARTPVEGWRVLSPHFHYIPCPDTDPWPPTMANGFRYNMKSPRKGLPRARRTGAPEAYPPDHVADIVDTSLAAIPPRLPDIL